MKNDVRFFDRVDRLERRRWRVLGQFRFDPAQKFDLPVFHFRRLN